MRPVVRALVRTRSAHACALPDLMPEMSKPRPKTHNVEAQTKRLKRGSLDLMLETSKPRPNN